MQIAYFKTEAEKKAFICGLAFVVGYLKTQKDSLVFDANTNNPYWITTENGHHFLINEEGTIQSGRFKNQSINHLGESDKKTSEGSNNFQTAYEMPERFESFEDYLRLEGSAHKDQSFSTKVRHYLQDTFKNAKISSGTGMPEGYEVVFSPSGIGKTASRMHPDAVWVLQYLPDVYRKGYITNENVEVYKDAHKQDTESFVYSALKVRHNNENYVIYTHAKKLKNKKLRLEHYFVGREKI